MVPFPQNNEAPKLCACSVLKCAQSLNHVQHFATPWTVAFLFYLMEKSTLTLAANIWSSTFKLNFRDNFLLLEF